MVHAARSLRHRAPLLVAAAGFFALSGVVQAHAGTIGFRVDSEVDTGSGLSVKITATHTGNEAAIDVAPEVEFLDARQSGEPVARFQPNENHVWQMRLRDKPLVPGAYVVVVRLRYSDTNGYPFEVTSVAPATPAAKAGPRVTGKFALPQIAAGGDAAGVLELKRPQGRSGNFEGMLVSPRGLRMEQQRFPIEFDAEGNATIDISMENEKLLAGTTVNVFALVTNDQFGFHQTDTVRGTVRVVEAQSNVSTRSFYLAAAAVAALLVVLELIGLRRRRP